MHSFDQRGHGRTHNHLSVGKQGHRGHIATEVDVIMKDISELLKREGANLDVPRYLLGHSLGGLMSVYYTMTRELDLNGLITIGKRTEREREDVMYNFCNVNILVL